MIPVLAVLAAVVFLGGALSGALALLAVSIHRTRHAPLSQMGSQRRGAVSRRLLTTTRRRGWGQ
jgi:hypothetical protein